MFKLIYLPIILFSVLLGSEMYDSIISDQVPAFGVLLYQVDDTTVKIAKLREFAESNGLKKNDVIISIDGKKIITRSDIFPILKFVEYGDSVRMVIRRANNEITLVYPVTYIVKGREKIALDKSLWANENVRLAIIPGDVTNVQLRVDKEKYSEWVKSIKIELATGWESKFLAAYKYEDKFTIIDRAKIDQLIEEIEFNQSGIVSQASALNVGESLGATHILYISLTGYPINNNVGAIGTETRRIIKVSTAEVLSSVVDQGGKNRIKEKLIANQKKEKTENFGKKNSNLDFTTSVSTFAYVFPTITFNKKNTDGEITGSRGIHTLYLGYYSKHYLKPLTTNTWNPYWFWGTCYIIIPMVGIGTEYLNDDGFFIGLGTVYYLPQISIGKYF